MNSHENLNDLRGAFNLFVEASKTLEAEYAALNQRVQSLDADLVRAHQTLSILLNALPAAVILVEQGVVSHANQAAQLLLPKLAIGEIWAIPAHWKASGRVNEYKAVINGQKKNLQVETIDDKDRSVIQVQDITSSIKAIADQEHLNRLLAMGELSASIAHQIRTPLATAVLYCGHLSDNSISQKNRKSFIKKLELQLLYLDRLTSKMLRFVGSQLPHTSTWDVRYLVKMSLMQISGLIQSEGVELLHNEPKEEVKVVADKEMLCSAIVAVLENAVQAAAHGGKSVSVTINCDQEKCYIGVLDTGPGISEKVADRLFEPFVTDRQSGTGLGLSVAQNTLRAHNGKITATNQSGMGAHFVISLPIFS